MKNIYKRAGSPFRVDWRNIKVRGVHSVAIWVKGPRGDRVHEAYEQRDARSLRRTLRRHGYIK
jgi:hypothetical protein